MCLGGTPLAMSTLPVSCKRSRKVPCFQRTFMAFPIVNTEEAALVLKVNSCDLDHCARRTSSIKCSRYRPNPQWQAKKAWSNFNY